MNSAASVVIRKQTISKGNIEEALAAWGVFRTLNGDEKVRIKGLPDVVTIEILNKEQIEEEEGMVFKQLGEKKKQLQKRV